MDNTTFNEYMKKFDESREEDVVVFDNSTYEQQWATAIDQALADAALEAFKTTIKNNIMSILEKPSPSDSDLKWLQRRIETKIDILDKVIHLSKTEGITHDESEQQSERHGEGRETSPD